MPAKALSLYEREVRANQYGLRKAVQSLRERPHRLDHCMQAMRMTTLPKAPLWKRIKALEP